MRRATRQAALVLATAVNLGGLIQPVLAQPLTPSPVGGKQSEAPGHLTPAQARWVEYTIELAWLADETTFACPLTVKVREGRVEVGGTVGTDIARFQALHLAREIGNLPLRDLVHLKLQAPPTMPDPSGPTLTDAAAHQLFARLGNLVIGMETTTLDGRSIILRGQVGSLEDKLLASQTLKGLPGCFAVHNELKLVAIPSMGKDWNRVTRDGQFTVAATRASTTVIGGNAPAAETTKIAPPATRLYPPVIDPPSIPAPRANPPVLTSPSTQAPYPVTPYHLQVARPTPTATLAPLPEVQPTTPAPPANLPLFITTTPAARANSPTSNRPGVTAQDRQKVGSQTIVYRRDRSYSGGLSPAFGGPVTPVASESTEEAAPVIQRVAAVEKSNQPGPSTVPETPATPPAVAEASHQHVGGLITKLLPFGTTGRAEPLDKNLSLEARPVTVSHAIPPTPVQTAPPQQLVRVSAREVVSGSAKPYVTQGTIIYDSESVSVPAPKLTGPHLALKKQVLWMAAGIAYDVEVVESSGHGLIITMTVPSPEAEKKVRERILQLHEMQSPDVRLEIAIVR